MPAAISAARSPMRSTSGWRRRSASPPTPASTQSNRIEELLHDPRVARDLERRNGAEAEAAARGLPAMARKRKGEPVNGWLVIDKPVGHDLDPGGRRRCGASSMPPRSAMAARSIPLATGVLPIALGEATKTVPFVMDGRKTLSLHRALGRGARHRRRRGRGHRDQRPAADAKPRSWPRCPASSARSSRCRRPSRPSRSTASGPMTWRGPARRSSWRRGGSPSTLRAARQPGSPTTPVFEVSSGKGAYMRALGRDLALALGTVGHIVGPAAPRRRPVRRGPGDFSGIAGSPRA